MAISRHQRVAPSDDLGGFAGERAAAFFVMGKVSEEDLSRLSER